MIPNIHVIRVTLAMLAAFGASAQAQQLCGSLENGYGPYDYRTAGKDKLELVEGAHFLPFVEQLVRGNTSSGPGGDIDYTLRAFPNHHRALLSMMNLARRDKSDRPGGVRYSVACWLDRAERFRPDDGMVKVLSGIYLLRQGKNQEAVAKMEEARALGLDDANFHYNLGLAYFEVSDFDKALASAHRAYALGFQLPGLRDMLKRAGRWSEPPASVSVQ